MKTTNNGIALLLDSAPLTWTSQEDRHLLLCKELTIIGIPIVLVFSGELKAEFTERFKSAGASVYVISYQDGTSNFHRKLKQIVRDHKIGIAHIIFFDYFSWLPWIARVSGIRAVIYEMQNSGTFTATSWKKLLLKLRTKVTTAPITKLIAISAFVKEQLIKAGIPAEIIEVRYLGVDIKRFVPDSHAQANLKNEYGMRPDELVLSTVSYLRPFKNPQVLVRTCSELKQKNVPAHLFVAGDGEMSASLKELAREIDVDDRIHWLGNLPDPKQLLQASDLFLLASTGEAFGLVLAEAMACGTPVVGTLSGAIPEVVEHGGTGILVPPNDPISMANAIGRLAQNRDTLSTMRLQAVERVRDRFTVERAVSETIAFYKGLGSPIV